MAMTTYQTAGALARAAEYGQLAYSVGKRGYDAYKQYKSSTKKKTKSSSKQSQNKTMQPITTYQPTSARDVNIRIKKRIKRKAVSINQPMKMFNIIAPPLTMQGEFKPQVYNDQVTGSYEGFRIVKQKQQDICQFVHMGFDEFGKLFQKGLTNPKTFRMINNYNADGEVSNNAVSTVQENHGSNVLLYTPSGSGSTNVLKVNDWWHNDNYELLVHSYIATYTLTNQSEFPMHFEFTEWSPREVIRDRIVASADSVWAQTGYRINYSNHQDPLSCAVRDIAEQNAIRADRDLVGNNNGDIQPATIDQAISQRNQSITERYFKETNRRYKCLTKKIVTINPGCSIDYTLNIPGFQRSANWGYSGSDLDIQEGNLSTSKSTLHTIPSWIKQTKFLVVRSWVPKHVYSSAGTPRVISITSAEGKYTITSKLNLKFRTIPKAPSPRHLELSYWRSVDYDPDGDNQDDALNSGITQTFMGQTDVEPDNAGMES